MQKLLGIGVLVVLFGFVLIFAGSVGQGSTSAAGVVFIGPVPIVFGSGPGAGALELLSVVIGAAMVVLVSLWGWRLSSKCGGKEGLW
jgi:uncharacterized membrane protein